MVSQCGIKANPINVDAIRNMAKPSNKKDVMKLTGMMAAHKHFISKLGEKDMPFFKILKKVDKFEWDDETNKALKALKAFLTTPPVMTAPADQETLYLYISTMMHVVSTVLVVEHQEPSHTHMVHQLVYYVSEVLSDSKICYSQVHKLLYAVLISSRKLHH
ncbi:uncharacterized mitochondrial protein AtMg00860-like [Setaria viridis]|uniref:uncharacterized mitochondrial protein AtMg00860-like n=1 Tax=Setaria viridis TaxID=4556 RepID=UPI003B3BC9A6